MTVRPRVEREDRAARKRLESKSSLVYGSLILWGDYGARPQWLSVELDEEPKAIRSHMSVLVTEGLAESLGHGSGKWRAVIPVHPAIPTGSQGHHR